MERSLRRRRPIETRPAHGDIVPLRIVGIRGLAALRAQGSRWSSADHGRCTLDSDGVPVLSTLDVLALKGRSLGPSAWLPIAQDRVDVFARAVEDWHWAHNDVELPPAVRSRAPSVTHT